MNIRDYIRLDRKSETPVFLQITNNVINHIRRGTLRRGLRLPGSREWAKALGVHRKTIVSAFTELSAQGWIEMISRKGTFVAQQLPDIKPTTIAESHNGGGYPKDTLFPFRDGDIVSFPAVNFASTSSLTINDGFPDIRFVPTELLLREFRSLSKRSVFRKYLMYGSPAGSPYLLETLADFLSDTRGLPITSNNILVTKGAQMGFYLAASVILKPGDEVIVGEPNYFAANLTLLQLKAKLNRVPVDQGGIDVNAVEKICRKKKIRLLYVIPHHHHPTTVTLTPERRVRLLELASKHKFAIIEDDYDFHYNSTPVMPMASLDNHGNVVYVGTLSKTLAPAIRIGFIVAPENFIRHATRLRRIIDRQGDSMIEAAIAELYKNGTMGRHIKKVVKVYHERRDNFCELLKQELSDHIKFEIPAGGMAVWVRLNKVKLADVSRQAEKKGLYMIDGSIYNTWNKDYNATRLGFASLNFKEQEKVVSVLKEILK